MEDQTSQQEDPEREASGQEPEDHPEEPGAEGGSSGESADKLPGAPADDDSELGDTDQHSSG